MNVLVAYATAHGSTRGIADRIAFRLREAGHRVDVAAVAEVQGIAGYDAVVVGSAVHSGWWLAEGSEFVHRNAALLAARPTWFFSVSSVGDVGSFFPGPIASMARKARGETVEMREFRAAIHPRDHRYFAGAIEREHYDLAGQMFMKAVGGKYGDHRNWPDIDAWAQGIARELPAREAVGVG